MDWNFLSEDRENISLDDCDISGFTLDCNVWQSERSFLTARFKHEKPLFCWNEFTEDAEVLE